MDAVALATYIAAGVGLIGVLAAAFVGGRFSMSITASQNEREDQRALGRLEGRGRGVGGGDLSFMVGELRGDVRGLTSDIAEVRQAQETATRRNTEEHIKTASALSEVRSELAAMRRIVDDLVRSIAPAKPEPPYRRR